MAALYDLPLTMRILDEEVRSSRVTACVLEGSPCVRS